MRRVLLVGAAGWIGSHLKKYLSEKGYQPFLLHHGSLEWDPDRGVVDPAALENYSAIINLSGDSIMQGRWSAAKKERIYNSRVVTTRLLAQTISQLQAPPQAFLNASAIGFYGARGDEELTEHADPGSGFLATVCRDWEEATQLPSYLHIRVVTLRFGMVLGSDGGALKQMVPLFRYGLGGTIGSGKQWVSWIAMEDLLRCIEFIMQHTNLHGPVNVVSPHPVRQAEFAQELARALHRPALFPLPAWVVKLVFGEKGSEMILSSVRAVPQVIVGHGFRFCCPDLGSCLREVSEIRRQK